MTLETVALELDLELIVLFGSQAREGYGRDTDLALLPRDPTRFHDGFSVARTLMNRAERSDLDVVWLPTASWLLQAQVARYGRVLVETRPGAFQDFQGVAAMRSLDSEIWRRAEAGFIEDFLKGGQGLDRELIRARLKLMVESLGHLKPVLEGGADDFVSLPTHFHTGERVLEILVECAARINTEVGRDASIAPTDYYSSFFAMVSAGWLEDSVARPLAQMAGLRNLVVHQYERVQLPELFRALSESIPHWTAYTAAIYSRL